MRAGEIGLGHQRGAFCGVLARQPGGGQRVLDQPLGGRNRHASRDVHFAHS